MAAGNDVESEGNNAKNSGESEMSSTRRLLLAANLSLEDSDEVWRPITKKQCGNLHILELLCDMLQVGFLWYYKFRSNLELVGFKFNDYDPCVANRTINGHQHTIRFHVDDVLSSHINTKLNDKFAEWAQKGLSKQSMVTEGRCIIS